MLSETITAIIITALVAPLSLELLKFVFALLNNTKQKAQNKSDEQDKKVAELERRLDDLRLVYNRDLEGLRASLEKEYSGRLEAIHKENNFRLESLHRDIENLRSENVKLQILVAENAVKLTLKDETIARLSRKEVVRKQ